MGDQREGQTTDFMIDFTCVCILDAFKNETASKSMERVLKLLSERKAKEIMKVKLILLSVCI